MKKRIDVLDKGFVELLDHMGSDLDVVNAARVSFDKESKWEYKHDTDCPELQAWDIPGACGCEPTKQLSNKDARLIRYLVEHNHWVPLAHLQVKLRIKLPIFVARQIMKSTVGFNYSEISMRYVDKAEYFSPKEWRARPEGNIKQGSSTKILTDFVPVGATSPTGTIKEAWDKHVILVDEMYNNLLNSGVAPEMARIALGLNTYTMLVVTGSFVAIARMCKLRAAPDAQWESQEYGRAIRDITKDLFPVSWEALFED